MDGALTMHVPARASRKAREADLAWQQYRGDAIDRVPEAARRDARNFKRSLMGAAEAIDAVAADCERWADVAADAMLKKRSVGKARALQKLRRMFHPAPVEVRQLGWLGETLLIRWLEPGDGLFASAGDPGFAQDGVVAHAISLAALSRTVLLTKLFLVEAPDHCLARLFQRGPKGVDAARALNGAADAFACMDMREVADLRRNGETLVLPAVGGAFLSNVIFGREKRGTWRVVASLRTFIAAQQAGANQRPLPPAADVGWSVLAGGWTLTRKLPGVAPAVSAEELDQLASHLDGAR